MSVETSVLGRFQFSTENAYSVSTCRPSRAEVSTTSRTEAMPARCPSTRRLWRSFAQRPLPSMMMATWRGRRSKSMDAHERLLLRARGNDREEILK